MIGLLTSVSAIICEVALRKLEDSGGNKVDSEILETLPHEFYENPASSWIKRIRLIQEAFPRIWLSRPSQVERIVVGTIGRRQLMTVFRTVYAS